MLITDVCFDEMATWDEIKAFPQSETSINAAARCRPEPVKIRGSFRNVDF